MGCSYEFKCDNCGLAANVSGGPDCGFTCETQTVWCPSCSVLQDVVVAEDKRDLPYFPLVPEFSRVVAKCHECGSNQVVFWSAGRPCPRCSGVVTQSESPNEFWD